MESKTVTLILPIGTSLYGIIVQRKLLIATIWLGRQMGTDGSCLATVEC